MDKEAIPQLETIIREETNLKDKLINDKKKFDDTLNAV